MSKTTDHCDRSHPSQFNRRVITASVVGTVLEWYDFYIYGTAAALVLGKVFFPSFSAVAGTLAAFATYGIGFVLRPAGGVILGRFGDRIGRRNVMIISLVSMGAATGSIGLLPGYRSIGVMAPLLLVLLRLVQSVGASAEFGSAVTLVSEHSAQRRRGLLASLPGLGVSLGILVGSGTFALFSLMPTTQFESWGWRMPFLVGFSLVAVGLYLRLRVTESPEFVRLQERHEVLRAPLTQMWKRQRARLLVAAGARSSDAVGGQLFNVFAISYVTGHAKLPSSVALTAATLASALGLLIIPLGGMLSDRFGRRPVYLCGLLFLVVYAFPFFWLIDTRYPGVVVLAFVLGQGGVWLIFGVSASYFAELFDVRNRTSGIVLSRSVSDPLAGLTPLLCAALLASTGASWSVSLFLLVFVVLALVSVFRGPETHASAVGSTSHASARRTPSGASRPEAGR